MNKFKKMMSVTLASCMAASALMMSAGAANTPVDTGTATLAPNVISNTTINQLKATAQNAIEQFFRESDKGCKRADVCVQADHRQRVRQHRSPDRSGSSAEDHLAAHAA